MAVPKIEVYNMEVERSGTAEHECHKYTNQNVAKQFSVEPEQLLH